MSLAAAAVVLATVPVALVALVEEEEMPRARREASGHKGEALAAAQMLAGLAQMLWGVKVAMDHLESVGMLLVRGPGVAAAAAAGMAAVLALPAAVAVVAILHPT